MKKLSYILIFVLVATLATGCDGLLNVSPRQEQRQDDMFESEDGFKSALIGVYIRLASKELYGANTSFYLTELMAQCWVNNNTDFPEDHNLRAWNFEHAKVEERLAETWENYYFCIATLNDILENMDNDRSIFRPGNYELIRGEALGLRGFLHAEILRLWGPIPSRATASTRAIPYAEVFSKDPSQFLVQTWETVVGKIERDLNAAEELLADDPIIEFANSDLNYNSGPADRPQDNFQLKRQARFNYYAVLGAKARFYNWIGNSTEALKYARLVIESERFRLATAEDISRSGITDYSGSLTMTPEHLFAVNNTNHQNVINEYFKDGDLRLIQSTAVVLSAYESSVDDIRNAPSRYWREINHGHLGIRNHFLKYSDKDDMESLNRIPLLRLSEMYFIFIENNPNVAESKTLFTEFVSKRLIATSYIDELDDPDTRRSRLEKEYRKEFYGEGQLWYFYKRHAMTTYSWPSQWVVPAQYQDYRLPFPRSQTSFEPSN